MPEGFCPVAPSEREECGYFGITKEECLDKPCCWDDTVPDAKWCFKKPGKYIKSLIITGYVSKIFSPYSPIRKKMAQRV